MFRDAFAEKEHNRVLFIAAEDYPYKAWQH